MKLRRIAAALVIVSLGAASFTFAAVRRTDDRLPDHRENDCRRRGGCRGSERFVRHGAAESALLEERLYLWRRG